MLPIQTNLIVICHYRHFVTVMTVMTEYLYQNEVEMSEQTIVESIKRYLKSVKDLFFWKEHGGIYGTAGIPDIIVCYKGRFIAFEVKQPGKVLTTLQNVTIKRIIECGGYALKVDNVNQVREVIEAFKNEI